MNMQNNKEDEALKHALSDAVLNMIHKAKTSARTDQASIAHMIQAQESTSDIHA